MVDRVIIMVLDGFGVGEAPDANKYGDEESNTLAGIYNNTSLNIPNMAKLGLYNRWKKQSSRALGDVWLY